MKINLKTDNFIYPYFVSSGVNKKEEIKLFPEIFRLSIDRVIKDIGEIKRLGLNKILLFGIADKKDILAKAAFEEGNVVSLAVRAIKKEFPDLTVMTDVCLCAYTVHGHCGIIRPQAAQRSEASPQETLGHKLQAKTKSPRLEACSLKPKIIIDNKATLKALSRIALAHVQAGADWVAPSAMAKRQVSAIRNILDKNGYKNTKIMGYSAKFASNFYGPFRNAADSAPKFGDRKGYQLNFNDATKALKEIKDDIKEGADMVMVKPALSYLDVIRQARLKFREPLAAYNVSGEYSLVKYGVRQGLWDERKIVTEIITSIKRAGADFIITYHAKDIAKWLK